MGITRLQGCGGALGDPLRKIVAVAALWCAGLVAVNAASQPKVVEDLPYGEVLFQFYQQDYFQAITHLLVARSLDRVPHHAKDSELLLGGMYLSYGLHNAAGDIFEKLLDGNVDPSVRDRAWFYLAKIWYQRGHADRAQQALVRIGDALPPSMASEVPLLKARVHMLQGEYGQAVAVLEDAHQSPEWAPFAQYNLGVALVRSGEPARGLKLLKTVGSMEVVSDEMAALRDRANVALGYGLLKETEHARAAQYLKRVRLEGPYSDKALLGLGWAYLEQGEPRKALVPWMKLDERRTSEPAVQEALLAIPFALVRLEAYGQAAQHYQAAIEAYEEHAQGLERTMAEIQRGELIETMIGETGSDSQRGWFWQSSALPASAAQGGLYRLLAGHEFQEGLKNYRDLIFLRSNLRDWSQNIDAYEDILATRREAFYQRLPRIKEKQQQMDLGSIRQRRDRLARRFRQAQNSGDGLALATGDEKRMLSKIERSRKRLSRVSAQLSNEELREKRRKLRIMEGLLMWRIETEFAPRSWEVRKSLVDLNAAVYTAERRKQSLNKAQRAAPRQFEGYDDRIAQARARIASLVERIDAVLARKQDYLKGLALDELRRQKHRIRTQLHQARFALARIYDRIGSRQPEQQ